MISTKTGILPQRKKKMQEKFINSTSCFFFLYERHLAAQIILFVALKSHTSSKTLASFLFSQTIFNSYRYITKFFSKLSTDKSWSSNISRELPTTVCSINVE